MSRSRKLLLGFFSFLPIILIAVYIITVFSFVFFAIQHAGRAQEDEIKYFVLDRIVWIVSFALVAVFSSLALLIYYIIHVVNNKYIDSTERIVWVLVFIFAGTIGFPVYWYMRIWKEPVPPTI